MIDQIRSDPKSVASVCDKCGSRLFAGALDGVCSVCLLKTCLGVLTESRPAGSVHSAGILSDFDDYELLEEIGRGGQGIVYRARQKSLDRIVALKVIGLGPAYIGATKTHIERFRLEAKAAASLNHPCMVPIYEIGERDGCCYFSMGLVEGRQLDEVIKREPMAFRRAVELIAKLARAVHYAHEHGILHRDIKPGNILLDDKGEPHLTDFGLARLVETESDVTRTAEVLGTPSYMAPEQAVGNNAAVSSATDVYGLGAVLYQLLTGQPPFAGGTTYETIKLLEDTEPRPPRLLNPKVDRDLSTVCLKCLEKDPKRRYPAAAGLAVDLERWLEGRPITARRVSSPERLWRWSKRNPKLAAATAAAFCSALAAMFLFFSHEGLSLLAAFAATAIAFCSAMAVPFLFFSRKTTVSLVPPEKSIAVLPFLNMSSDPENEYLSDGLTEDLIMAFSQLKGLRVPARTSSFAFKGRNEDIRQIGSATECQNDFGRQCAQSWQPGAHNGPIDKCG